MTDNREQENRGKISHKDMAHQAAAAAVTTAAEIEHSIQMNQDFVDQSVFESRVEIGCSTVS